MKLTYRSEKGAPLSAQEVDQNFQSLDARIAQLEAAVFEAEPVPDPKSTPQSQQVAASGHTPKETKQ